MGQKVIVHYLEVPGSLVDGFEMVPGARSLPQDEVCHGHPQQDGNAASLEGREGREGGRGGREGRGGEEGREKGREGKGASTSNVET